MSYNSVFRCIYEYHVGIHKRLVIACILYFTTADICAELAALKVADTLAYLKVQHASNEVRHTMSFS